MTVRIEGVRGSNPLSSTNRSGNTGPPRVLSSDRVTQMSLVSPGLDADAQLMPANPALKT